MINLFKIIRFFNIWKNQNIIFNTLGVLMLLGTLSCTNTKEAPPFPILENEYAQPKTKPFKFSEPDTLKWITKKSTEIKKLPSKKFSWDNLESKPFDIGYSYPLTSPMSTQDFDWNSLPSTDFSMDDLPKENLKIKVTALGDPKIVKAEYPTPLPQSSRGVTTLDSNFGLPSESQCLLKDNDSMLWFGSNYAIARYDGEHLQIYGIEQGLDTQSVFSLFQDSKGRIWVGDNAGSLSVIDLEAKLVYQLSSAFLTRRVFGMMEADDGKIWLSNNGAGYNIIDLDNKSIQNINQEHGLLGNFSIQPFQDNEGLIWLAAGDGINILDLKAGKNITLTQEYGLHHNRVFSVHQDQSDNLWIYGVDGATIINASKTYTTQFTPEEIFNDSASLGYVFQDTSGIFWFGTPNGRLFSYNETEKTLERFDLNFNPGNFLVNIIEDNQGQIWAAALQGGIYKVDLSSGRPGNYTTQDGLSDINIWSTLEAKDGTIWIGSEGGIDVFDPKTNTIKRLGAEQGLVHRRNTRLIEDTHGRIWACGNLFGVSIIDPKRGTIQQLTINEGLHTNSIRSIVETENGVMWMGGNASELQIVDLENAVFKYHTPDSTVVATQNNKLIMDHLGNVWMGTVGNGIEIIDPKTNIRRKLTTEHGLNSNAVYSLTTDHNNNVWAATDNGVELINVATQEITTFTAGEGLASSDVYAIIERNDEIFTGTSNGLTILKPKQLIDQDLPYWNVKTIGRRQGLNWLDFAENSFSVDKHGKFWAGVDTQVLTVIDEIKTDTTAFPTYITGISILDKTQVFDDQKLVQAKRSKHDTIWTPKQDKPFIRGQAIQDSTLSNSNNIIWETIEGHYKIPVGLTLPPDQNYLSFNYSALQYNNQDKVVYRYFLEGIDKTWSPISSESSSENYRDLPPGNYTFKVASKGFSGVWGPPAEFNFSILPPWWQTKWAYGLYFILLLGLMRVVHIIQKKRTLRKERERSQKRELEQAKVIEKAYEDLKATQAQLIQSEKMASLGELTAGIAHEIQNPLNFVNNFSEINMELIDEMQDEIQSGNTDEIISLSNDIKANQSKINHHGKRADAIVKGMLQHSRNSSSERHLTNINDLADEYLRLSYHGLRAKDKSFNATMKTDFDDSIGKINIVPQDMGRVILNLITNAFYAVNEKKQEAKKSNQDYEPTVTVSSKLENNKVIIAVKDNGNGIPQHVQDKIFQPFYTTKPAGQGTGLGLSLSYDIVKTHGGELRLDTQPGEGTTFSIVLPMNN